jgi:methionyl aminopeptidase
MFKYANLLKYGKYKVIPPASVPTEIIRPWYAATQGQADYTSSFEGEPKILNIDEQAKMRKAGKIAARALKAGLDAVRVGITTEEVDSVC